TETSMVDIETICNWTQGSWTRFEQNTLIKDLIIDSRKITNPEHGLFIALQTAGRNGHNFLKNAYEKGARNFLVHETVNPEDFPGSNIILVKETLAALQKLAATYRKEFQIPVIGITGSNGKTVVKEWLYQLLQGSKN